MSSSSPPKGLHAQLLSQTQQMESPERMRTPSQQLADAQPAPSYSYPPAQSLVGQPQMQQPQIQHAYQQPFPTAYGQPVRPPPPPSDVSVAVYNQPQTLQVPQRSLFGWFSPGYAASTSSSVPPSTVDDSFNSQARHSVRSSVVSGYGQPIQQTYFPSDDTLQQDAIAQYNYPPAQQLVPHRMGATLFRYKTVKTIPLTPSGNFVVEVPVARQLSDATPDSSREFTHLRYTAVTGDPDQFYERGYYLRPAEHGRSTELFIVVTMYNEDESLFLKTWKSLRRNINHLCRKRHSSVWGPDGWKKVVVCIVSDGRMKINQTTLAVIGALGVFQDGLMKTSINGQDVTAHMFEYTTCVNLDNQMNLKRPDRNSFPVQVLFCLKEKNAKKINSHRWFFNAFGRILNPNVCVLIDVGTKPTDKSLYHLWKEFDMNPNVAGACGEIYAEQGVCSTKLLNPLVAAQNFEYKMSNILDKPFESVFGFISVLPGAFSAYRYRALQNRGDGDGPLDKYFIGEKMHGGTNLTMANMYLAEDRILCYELVTKRNEAWVLRYVKKAKAETDVPDSVPEYISQRRRWLNGSFFAGLHAIIHFYQIFRSGHALSRKLLLLLQMLYNVINLIFNWFALANFYLTFYFLSIAIVQQQSTDPFFGAGQPMFITLRNLYLFSMVMIFVTSLGNRPQASKLMYTFCFALFALIMATLVYMSGFTVKLAIETAVQESTTVDANGNRSTSVVSLARLLTKRAFRDLVLSLVSTYGVYIISSLLHASPWHMLTSFVQYLLLLPSFVNILMVYAFCNLHDVSWGTKGDNQPSEAPAPVKVERTESGDQIATVDLPVDQTDIEASYSQFLVILRKSNASQESDNNQKSSFKPKPKPSVSALQQEDYFKAFRTNVVLFWILSNSLLAALLTTDQVASMIGINATDPAAFNPYLSFILWSVAGLSIARFIGSVMHLVFRRRQT